MTKFTKGPWLIAEEDKTFVYALAPNKTNSFWALLQTAGAERVSRKELEANAHLIAAAPEMYEALALMVEYFNKVEESILRMEVPTSQLVQEFFKDDPEELAKLALAKARGES